jgi:prepilin-type N-terminal cleavage/methylation domain-containing protein/prepilin-type processing-associated H-X9-DG protein
MRSVRHGGFTLIELLVAVSVFLLLTAILLPVLAQARDSARRVTCISKLHQLGMAHSLYTQDYDETLPTWCLGGSRYQMQIWTDYLRPYYRHLSLLQEALAHPNERPLSGWTADYALCAWGPVGAGTVENPYCRWPGAPTAPTEGSRPMRAVEVRRPSEVLQFADGFTARSGLVVSTRILAGRHGSGRLNGAFVDGHAGTISDSQWAQVHRDARGYFRAICAADR